jgi:hypothetical protein
MDTRQDIHGAALAGSPAATVIDTRQAMHSSQARMLDTAGLRREFLVTETFHPGALTIYSLRVSSPASPVEREWSIEDAEP